MYNGEMVVEQGYGFPSSYFSYKPRHNKLHNGKKYVIMARYKLAHLHDAKEAIKSCMSIINGGSKYTRSIKLPMEWRARIFANPAIREKYIEHLKAHNSAIEHVTPDLEWVLEITRNKEENFSIPNQDKYFRNLRNMLDAYRYTSNRIRTALLAAKDNLEWHINHTTFNLETRDQLHELGELLDVRKIKGKDLLVGIH